MTYGTGSYGSTPYGAGDDASLTLGVGDPAAVWNFVLPNGKTAAMTLIENNEMLRIVLAGIAGQTSGVGTNTETYYGIDGVTPRIIATFDSAGNRIDTTVDGIE